MKRFGFKSAVAVTQLLHNLALWNGRAAKARKGHGAQVTPVGKPAVPPQKATTAGKQQQGGRPRPLSPLVSFGLLEKHAGRC